jgi:hypothetical protein
LASCRSRSEIGTIHSQRTGSPPNVNPDRSGGSGPSSAPGESSSSTASGSEAPEVPPFSGNVDGSWYHRTLCPGPNHVTACHG